MKEYDSWSYYLHYNMYKKIQEFLLHLENRTSIIIVLRWACNRLVFLMLPTNIKTKQKVNLVMVSWQNIQEHLSTNLCFHIYGQMDDTYDT